MAKLSYNDESSGENTKRKIGREKHVLFTTALHMRRSVPDSIEYVLSRARILSFKTFRAAIKFTSIMQSMQKKVSRFISMKM
jgi:hypothetical protein